MTWHDGGELEDIGQVVVDLAIGLGADEVTARASRGASTEISRRDGQIEKLQQSRSRHVSVALLVDGRYSTHVTSDLRPEALRTFLERSVEATRHLEPDEHRGLPSLDDMGVADTELDMRDVGWDALEPGERRAWCEQLEQAVAGHAGDLPLRSVAAYTWDSGSAGAMVCSHGFRSSSAATSFGHAVSISLEDADGRLPEAFSFHQAHHREDLGNLDDIARDALERARGRLGSGPAPSGRYPLLLENRNTSRMLGMLLSPMSGTALYEQRSCMAGKEGQRIASPALTLIDDPLVPRGLASRPCDGDGLPSRRRTLLDDGVLTQVLVGVYNGRRLGRPPTGGSTSNLVVPPGPRSPADIAAELPRAIRVEGFLGGNANPTTGDYSFGIQGTLLEHGVAVASLSEMNVSGNIFELFERFVEAASDTWRYGSWCVPTLLFDDIQFSGS